MAPFSWYRKSIGSHPLIETGSLGAGGALAGYHGANYMANKTLQNLIYMTGAKTPQEVEAIKQQLEEDGTMRWIKVLGGVAGAGLGAGYALQKHVDTSSGLRGAISSLTDADYYTKNPDALKRLKASKKEKKDEAYQEGGRDRADFLDSVYDDGRLAKQGSLDDPFTSRRIPISYTLDTIQGDPFLSIQDKERTNSFIFGAENSDSGVTDSRSIMRSALQAGIGFGVAHTFGKVIGNIFSLPEENTQRLSTIGGIAGAIANTGILERGF
jgi:hypothetical protein